MHTSEEERPEDLLTSLAYALSLAPPRAPPMDSAHRALMTGRDPSRSNFHLFPCHKNIENTNRMGTRRGRQKRNAAAPDRHASWTFNLLRRAHRQRCHHGNHQHPHLQENRDVFTLWLDKHISVPTWNKLRDDGWLRAVADGMVLLGIPAMVVTSPRAARQFVTLSLQVQTIPYGPHSLQIMELFERSKSKELIVFVHGGAWGSGMPWMYRLVAQGFQGHVAVIGYRTYPDADVPGQVTDLSLALRKLQTIFSDITQFTIIGHSSGAHIALLHIVQEAIRSYENSQMPPYHTFVGLSGPYDIAHHYDFEAARGVEELSPLKAAGGLTLERLKSNTPAQELENFLLYCEQQHRPKQNEKSATNAMTHATCVQPYMPNHILLVHGMEDMTVPFTATAEVARRLSHCGLAPQQLYLAQTGHQDTVMHMMLGGLTYRKVIEWLRNDKLLSTLGSSMDGVKSRL